MNIPQTKYLIAVPNARSLLLQQYISGALLATSLAIAVQLLQLQTLSASLTVSLWCVAVAMPGLAFDFLLDLYTKERGHVLEVFPKLRYDTLYATIVLIALTALGAAIHHFLPFAAYLFAALAALAFYRMRRYVSLLEAEISRSEGSASNSKPE